MKIKLQISMTIIVLILGLSNCSKDCITTITTCKETVPTDEMCLAAFERWFFNKTKNKCEKIGYSGCSQKGFATQQECDGCKCK